MRNLKKVLSMVLAVSMMLSMMVFAGAAETKTEAAPEKAITSADLTDMDKVVNKEAVALLVDLGIINGIKADDGTYTYAPTDGINRAAYAKMIYAMMLNKSNADVYKGTDTGLKDVKGHWAEGFIAYCVSTEIAAGDTDKNFKPDDAIKTVTGAKMLLTALGYDATLSKYENDKLWSINIMKDAQLAGLLDGITLGADDELTRDAAALMIFNALMATTVTPIIDRDQGVAYLSKYEHSAKTQGDQVFGLATVHGMLTANEATGGAAGKSTIANSPMSIVTDLKDIGKDVTYYTFKRAGTTVNSSTAVASANVKMISIPVGTIVADGSPAANKVEVSTWLTDNGITLAAAGNKIFTNYASSTDTVANVKALLVASKAGQSAYFIDNDKLGDIDALVINTKAIDYVTGDVKTAVSGKNNTVYIPGVLSGYTNVKNVIGYAGLKTDDVVFTMSINNGAVTYIEKAASFTGKITGSNATNKKVFVDGTPYDISDLADAKFDTVAEYTALGYDKDVTFWTDADGKIACAEAHSTTTASAKLAVVVGYAAAGNNGVSSTLATAKLLFTDGTTEVVDVSKDSVGTFAVAVDPNSAIETAKLFDMVTYTIDDDGYYVLKEAATKNTVSAFLTGKSIETGKPASVMGTTSTNGFVGNADTVFITMQTSTDGKQITGYTVANGIAKAPSYNGTAQGFVVSKDNVAKLVFVAAGTELTTGTGDYLYTQTRDDATYSVADKTYTIEAFVNGVKENVVVSKKAYESASGLSANGLYKVTMESGIVTGATAAAAGQVDALAGVSHSGGVIGAGTSNVAKSYWTYTDTTVVYVVDTISGKTTATAIKPDAIQKDTNDVVSVWGNSTTKVADVVIITKVAMGDLAASSMTGLKALLGIKTAAGTTSLADTKTAAASGTARTPATVTADSFTETVAADKFLGVSIDVAAAKNLTVKVSLKGARATDGSDSVTIAADSTDPAAANLAIQRASANDKGATLTITVTDGDTEFVYSCKLVMEV